MPAKLFEKIIQHLKGAKCTLTITREGVLFVADAGSRSILDTNHAEVIFEVKASSEEAFPLSYLKPFTKTTSCAAVVILSH